MSSAYCELADRINKGNKIMTDETNLNSEGKELATQVETPVNEVVNDAAVAKREADERNWKQMRIKNAELERQLKERDQMFEKILQAQLSQQAPKEIDELDSISADEFIPKGKVEKLVEKKAQKYAEDIVKREVEKHLKQQNDSQFMDRLNRHYSDFSEIVNPETLSLLEEQEPELAQTIADLKDPYKIGMQSYKYIKAMGISSKVPETRRQKEIEKAIDKSEKSVQSPMAFDKRPIAQAFQMTDAMKKDLYREMMGYASMASGVPEMS
jgi:hypothetical protein